MLRNEFPLSSYGFLSRQPIWCAEMSTHWIPLDSFGFFLVYDWVLFGPAIFHTTSHLRLLAKDSVAETASNLIDL